MQLFKIGTRKFEQYLKFFDKYVIIDTKNGNRIFGRLLDVQYNGLELEKADGYILILPINCVTKIKLDRDTELLR